MHANSLGSAFLGVSDQVQIIGISVKSGELKVNLCKAKQLTNKRVASKEKTVHLNASMQMPAEDAVEHLVEGVFAVEVTRRRATCAWV